MNLLEAFRLHVPQAVRLVPASRELSELGWSTLSPQVKTAHHIERDLAADAVREAVVGELLLEDLDKLLPALGFLEMMLSGCYSVDYVVALTLSYASNSLRSLVLLSAIREVSLRAGNRETHGRCVSANRRDVDETTSKFDERSTKVKY